MITLFVTTLIFKLVSFIYATSKIDINFATMKFVDFTKFVSLIYQGSLSLIKGLTLKILLSSASESSSKAID